MRSRAGLVLAAALWLRVMLGLNMTDRNTGGNNLVNWLLQAIFCLTATTTYTPGAGGGSAKTVTPPFRLRLMSAAGSGTANGTELSGATGYTAGGASMGSPAFGTPAAGVITGPVTAVSWTNSGGSAWPAVAGIEVWDSAATPLRYLQGALTGGAVTVNAGNTLQFAANSVSADGSAW